MESTRVVIVTGASRGIGQAIARAFARAGERVVGTATSAGGAAAIAADLETIGPGHLGLALDVADPASLDAFNSALQTAGLQPGVLVNNAGITRDNLLMRMKDDEWQSVLDTNLTGLFRVVRPALRAMMKARWGRIINLSSVVARMGNAGQTNYVASKAGIEGFTRSLAQELASRNITVNAVAPGFIGTDMTAALNETQTAQMLERIPLARMGDADEVAHAVSFLASAGAGYVTGATIPVNGGLYMG